MVTTLIFNTSTRVLSSVTLQPFILIVTLKLRRNLEIYYSILQDWVGNSASALQVAGQLHPSSGTYIQGPLKGQRYVLDIFRRFKHLTSSFCVCADCFQGVSKAFYYPVKLLSFYLLLCTPFQQDMRQQEAGASYCFHMFVDNVLYNSFYIRVRSFLLSKKKLDSFSLKLFSS